MKKGHWEETEEGEVGKGSRRRMKIRRKRRKKLSEEEEERGRRKILVHVERGRREGGKEETGVREGEKKKS